MMLYGPDLSGWNKITDIDEAVKHMDFVYLKATEGKTNVSKYFTPRRHAFTERGIPTGAYHFAWLKKHGINEPVKQAKWFCKQVGKLGQDDLIPVLDIEGGWHQPRAKIIAWVNAWLEVVEDKLGTMVGVYTFRNYWKYKLKEEGIWDRPLWLASTCKIDDANMPLRNTPKKPIPGWNTSLWQYSHRGIIPGIKGKVDLNRMSTDDLTTWSVEQTSFF